MQGNKTSQTEIHARVCPNCELEANCDAEADLVEMFCSWVVMHMAESVGGMQNQGWFLEQKLPAR